MLKLSVSPYVVCEVYFSDNEKEFYRLRKKHLHRDEHMGSLAGCVESNDSCSVNVVGLFDGTHPTLIHELSHVAINVFQAVSMNVNAHTTEAFAYFLESLYTQCVNYMEKKKPITTT